MEGYMQREPGSTIWRKHMFSEFRTKDPNTDEEVIVPGFERTIVVNNKDIDGSEWDVRTVLEKKGKVSRFEGQTSKGIQICLGVLSHDEHENGSSGATNSTFQLVIDEIESSGATRPVVHSLKSTDVEEADKEAQALWAHLIQIVYYRAGYCLHISNPRLREIATGNMNELENYYGKGCVT